MKLKYFCCVAGAIIAVALAEPASNHAYAASEFPFGHELLLDARPMKGSKRVPVLDIAPNGTAQIDLWCDSLRGQVIVVENTITVLTGAKTMRACPPERVKGDDDMIEALQQVTTWRMNGDSVEFVGPRTLRFRIPTN
jgi:heat shock protein HslJ